MNIIIRDLTDIKDHIKLLEHPIKKDSVCNASFYRRNDD